MGHSFDLTAKSTKKKSCKERKGILAYFAENFAAFAVKKKNAANKLRSL